MQIRIGTSLLRLWLHQDGTQHRNVSLANATHQKGNALRQLPHLPPLDIAQIPAAKHGVFEVWTDLKHFEGWE